MGNHIEGRWETILRALAEKNIHVLAAGTIERYLPCFGGNLFAPTPGAKRNAVEGELEFLQGIQESAASTREAALADRYTALYAVVNRLPSKAEVDLDGTLRSHLSDYVHELQKTIQANHAWTAEQIKHLMGGQPLAKGAVVSLGEIQRREDGGFEAMLVLPAMFGRGRRTLQVDSNTTIGNMRPFAQSELEGS